MAVLILAVALVIIAALVAVIYFNDKDDSILDECYDDEDYAPTSIRSMIDGDGIPKY